MGQAYLGVLCSFCLLVMLLVLVQERRERQQLKQQQADQQADPSPDGVGERGGLELGGSNPGAPAHAAPAQPVLGGGDEPWRLPPPPDETAGVHLPPSPELSVSPCTAHAAHAADGVGAAGSSESAKEREREREAPPTRLTALMPFCYPVVIGTLETLVQMCMKGGSSML